MRYVIISFVFMGFAFYELSGGADFEPRGQRNLESAEAEPPRRKAPEQLAIPVAATELVAKPAIQPRRSQPAPTATAEAETKPELTQEEAIAQLARISTGLNTGLFPQDPAQSVTLASLEDGALSLQTLDLATTDESEQTAAPAEPQPDLREVLGTRVNMRDGPGTVYPIIARLNIGHQVEVLGDSGTGWLRLRVLPEQNTGWIASSLISKKTN